MWATSAWLVWNISGGAHVGGSLNLVVGILQKSVVTCSAYTWDTQPGNIASFCSNPILLVTVSLVPSFSLHLGFPTDTLGLSDSWPPQSHTTLLYTQATARPATETWLPKPASAGLELSHWVLLMWSVTFIDPHSNSRVGVGL